MNATASTTTTQYACPRCGAPYPPSARFCGDCGLPLGTADGRAARSTGRASGLLRPAGSLQGHAGDLLYAAIAAVVAIVVSHVPLIDSVIYPFKLFGTFIHEWSHALVALITGGHVVALQINANLSGETYSRGGWPLLITSAGYIGVAMAGAVLLLAPTRRAKQTLTAIGALAVLLPLAGALLLGALFSVTTWAWAVVFAAVALVIGLRATPHWARLFQLFLAVELCLTAIDALRTLAWLAITAPNGLTDATIAGHETHLPALLWVVVWGLIALAVIALAVRRVVRRALAP